jgi:hypothetical protein
MECTCKPSDPSLWSTGAPMIDLKCPIHGAEALPPDTTIVSIDGELHQLVWDIRGGKHYERISSIFL